MRRDAPRSIPCPSPSKKNFSSVDHDVGETDVTQGAAERGACARRTPAVLAQLDRLPPNKSALCDPRPTTSTSRTTPQDVRGFHHRFCGENERGESGSVVEMPARLLGGARLTFRLSSDNFLKKLAGTTRYEDWGP